MIVDPFPFNSRYHGIPTAVLETVAAGWAWRRGRRRAVVYLRRRFVPPADQLVLLQEHAVEDKDRLDNLAAHYLGDPLVFWRIADANNAMRPEELTERIGRRLRITLPAGVSGAPV